MRFHVWLVMLVVVGIVGCGYSEQEWQAQLDKQTRIESDHRALQEQYARVTQELESMKQHVQNLEDQLAAAGVDISQLSENLQGANTQITELAATLEERERALEEYKARAKQLEAIRARFELLRKKLEELTKLGLAVQIRNNRMIISLPGDVLFDSGRDKLRKEGEDILMRVAKVINNDPSLRSRDYQVSGHTDNKPLQGGVFKDNWGLSLMRARQVLLYLVDPDKGALPVGNWSAAGYADTDPVASNTTDTGRQQNRRCELVVLPSVEEMLDLKRISE